MIVTQPTSSESLSYSIIKIEGCTDTEVTFNFFNMQPQVSKRRYCNKVLVHECISVPESDTLILVDAEFTATDDPCYKFLDIQKSVSDGEATVELIVEGDGATGVAVFFNAEETCDMPERLAYKLYGTTDANRRILLSQGNLYITKCSCDAIAEICDEELEWEEAEW